MAGLETIALAVAHLESIQDGNAPPPVSVLSDAAVPTGKLDRGSELPYPKLHGRMVSDDSIYDVNHRSLAVASVEPQNAEMAIQSSHDQHQQWSSNDAHQTVPSKRKSIAKQTFVNTTLSDGIYQEKELNDEASGPAGILLEKIAMVNEDLGEFFTLMDKLEQLALPNGMKPAEIPKPDEVIFQVQRYDVLLGRGGETNHHVGNIQYRQLVKACQPAYLAAKRRDKPRIAVAIVQVVRAHSGRFLKKHANDSTWGDVGSIRAREKTSQALREGAPELRGVESQRSQLLIEAVQTSIERKLKQALDGSNVEFSYDPRQMHLPNMHVMSNGNETHSGGNSRDTTTHNRNAQAQSTIEASNAIARPLLIPPKGLPHYPMHHHVPMPMVPGHMFYHHPHGHVMYHPNAGMDARYHHAYSDKRAMVVPSAGEPPKKRQQVMQIASTQLPTELPKSHSVNHNSKSLAETSTIDKDAATSLISADNSEEDPVPIRSASPASSTSSSKNANTCRGPRLKLLKQRFEEGASAVLE